MARITLIYEVMIPRKFSKSHFSTENYLENPWKAEYYTLNEA
jgi:hypothetical protein